jgi:hypothetical protein
MLPAATSEAGAHPKARGRRAQALLQVLQPCSGRAPCSAPIMVLEVLAATFSMMSSGKREKAQPHEPTPATL